MTSASLFSGIADGRRKNMAGSVCKLISLFGGPGTNEGMGDEIFVFAPCSFENLGDSTSIRLDFMDFVVEGW